jgi:hypothetical protein
MMLPEIFFRGEIKPTLEAKKVGNLYFGSDIYFFGKLPHSSVLAARVRFKPKVWKNGKISLRPKIRILDVTVMTVVNMVLKCGHSQNGGEFARYFPEKLLTDSFG